VVELESVILVGLGALVLVVEIEALEDLETPTNEEGLAKLCDLVAFPEKDLPKALLVLVEDLKTVELRGFDEALEPSAILGRVGSLMLVVLVAIDLDGAVCGP